jgi:hypothetical protein
VWEETSKSTEVSLSCGGRKASFHADYSCGTAATRGTEALAEGQHFWEIKMTSPVYGTDMVGTVWVLLRTTIMLSLTIFLKVVSDVVINPRGFINNWVTSESIRSINVKG